jgi:hypothetical protein
MPKPFVGVRELITNTLSGCTKAVVSGIIIDGDQFEGRGKPDPAS